MNGSGPLFGFLLGFLIFVPWGWYKLSQKNRGWGYYALLIYWPLVGFIVACCLSKKEKPTSTELATSEETPSTELATTSEIHS